MWAAILLTLIPHTDVQSDDIDVLELNHYYDGQGQAIFSQFIFWDWNPNLGTHTVRAWTMANTRKNPQGNLVCKGNTPLISGGPIPTAAGWVLRYTDRSTNHTPRRITARAYRETWTQFDPEVRDQERLAKQDRRPLSRLRPK